MRSRLLAIGVGVAAFVAVLNCGDGRGDADCDHLDRHCRTVCNYGYACSSYWGCCQNQCWYTCTSDGRNKPAEGSSDAPPPSSSPAPLPPPDADASADGAAPAAKGVLCSPCAANDDCQEGAVCIQPGAGDAGVGSGSFCGHPCQDSAKDCPVGFSCTAVGGSMQCTPNDNVCD